MNEFNKGLINKNDEVIIHPEVVRTFLKIHNLLFPTDSYINTLMLPATLREPQEILIRRLKDKLEEVKKSIEHSVKI